MKAVPRHQSLVDGRQGVAGNVVEDELDHVVDQAEESHQPLANLTLVDLQNTKYLIVSFVRRSWGFECHEIAKYRSNRKVWNGNNST